MKSGDIVIIVKVCAPFHDSSLLGKTSKVEINESGVPYLTDIGINIGFDFIEKYDEYKKYDYSVYNIIPIK